MSNVIDSPITRNPLLKAAIVALNVLLLIRPGYYIVTSVLNLLDGYRFSATDSLFFCAYLIEAVIAVLYIVLCLKIKLTPKIIGIVSICNSILSILTLFVGRFILLGRLNFVQIYFSMANPLLSSVLSILVAIFFYMSNKRNSGWAIAGLVNIALTLFMTVGNLFSTFGTLAVETKEVNREGLRLVIFNNVSSIVAIIFSVLLILVVLKLKSTEEN